MRMTTEEFRALSAPRRNKYGARRVRVPNEKMFDSVAEFAHWQKLKGLEAAGYIRDLQRQVAFELAPAVVFTRPKRRKKPALRYVADFVYTDAVTGEHVVADCKGVITPLYRAKKHLMMAVHGIEVREVRA